MRRTMLRLGGPGRTRFGPFYYATVHHTEFDPDWPIVTDWPEVIRGIRGSLHANQPDFAELCGLGRATVERWESKRTVPFRGDALQLLTVVRSNLNTPVQAGQALNLAAAAVLPHITRPTAQYVGRDITSWLKKTKHDHSDLARGLLQALSQARILVPIDPDGDELENLYFPLAGALRRPTKQPNWAHGLIGDLQHVSTGDRKRRHRPRPSARNRPVAGVRQYWQRNSALDKVFGHCRTVPPAAVIARRQIGEKFGRSACG